MGLQLQLHFLFLFSIFLLVARVSSKATLQQPIKSVYINWEATNWGNPSQNIINACTDGFKLIIITSYNGSTSVELADAWEGAAASNPQLYKNTIQQAHAVGAQVLVQLIIQEAYQYAQNATVLGINTATFVQKNFLDGVEIYLLGVGENFSGGTMVAGETVQWVVDLHTAIRTVLGPDGVITHGPYAAYFGPIGTDSTTLPGVTGGYTSVYTQLQSSIDYLSIFYFSTGDCYGDYQSIFVSAPCQLNTAVLELNTAAFIPLTTIIVVKPRDITYAYGGGFVDADDLHSFVTEAARSIQWNTGVGLWVFDAAGTVVQFMDTVYEPEVPSPPTTPLLLSKTGVSVSITWNASFYDGNAPITSYNVRRDSKIVYSGLAMSFTDSGLLVGTTYTYTVEANNTQGASDDSLSISVTTQNVPLAPTSLFLQAQNATSITVSWAASVVDADHPVSGYMLSRDNIEKYTGTNLAYTDTGLTPGTSYQYTVLAYNAWGNSLSSTPTMFSTMKTIPGAPSILSVKAITSFTSIFMTWSVAVTGGSNITSYRLHNPVVNEDLYTGTQSFFNDTGLTPNTTYYYAVAATNAVGEGPFSPMVTLKTLSVSSSSFDIIACADDMVLNGGVCSCKPGLIAASSACISLLTIIIIIVVPIVVILLIIGGVFFWRRHKASQEAYIVGDDGMLIEMGKHMTLPSLQSEYLTTNLITEFSELKIRSKLGTGGSGVVYQGIWRNIEVAVKEYRDQNIQTTDFIRESEIHAKLRHPNVVQLLAICLPPHLCAISEFMNRGSLTDVLEKKASELTWEIKCRMLLDIAKGMDYLHKSKIIHRDLKSQNCLVDKNWNCKIADFGTSKLIKEDTTATVYVPRTAQWTAPEVIVSNLYSEKSDVFSYGVIMWEVATGKLPYQGVFAYQVEDKTVRGIRPSVPQGIESWYEVLMQQCWHNDAVERPAFEDIIRCMQITVVDKQAPPSLADNEVASSSQSK